MPRHPDFEKLRNKFIEEYGPEKGESIYYAYLHNEGLKEEISISEQKKKDAISNNYNKIKSSLNDYIFTEKEKYSMIIDKFITQSYLEGISEAAQELSMLPSEFGDLRQQQNQLKVLKENSKQLAFNLLDDITKEVTLLITDANLNNIPFTNQELKKDIQNIFGKYEERLKSQVVSETDRTFNTALEFGYKKSGVVTHKQWVSVIDDKTSSVCQQLNGEIVEIGQPFSIGIYTPPAHPNCRSRIKSITISNV